MCIRDRDSSVKKLKVASRPVEDEMKRSQKLMALNYVDHVIIFKQLTPRKLISELKPDVLVKGGDYDLNKIVGVSSFFFGPGFITITKVENVECESINQDIISIFDKL